MENVFIALKAYKILFHILFVLQESPKYTLSPFYQRGNGRSESLCNVFEINKQELEELGLSEESVLLEDYVLFQLCVGKDEVKLEPSISSP